jgi:phosphatidylserine decarboxylase
VYFLYAGVKELLQNISEKQGAKMDSLESAADIPKFVESYKVWQCFF